MEQAFTAADTAAVQEMNDKTIRNRFFTPDRCYIDLALFKDIPIGVIYADLLMKDAQEEFITAQAHINNQLTDYQSRRYDTVNNHFKVLGYDDSRIEYLLSKQATHNHVFAVAPATRFFELLIRHTVTNQNNSRPANKYNKKKVEGGDGSLYTLDPIPVTYHINTYPLKLTPAFLENIAKELGEGLGVNIRFLHKDPKTFDKSDWDDWMKDIECFYLDSLGAFTRSDFTRGIQGEMQFMGVFFFARKRFEKAVMAETIHDNFENQIAEMTAILDVLCNFAWIQNNDLRLTEQPTLVTEEQDPVTP